MLDLKNEEFLKGKKIVGFILELIILGFSAGSGNVAPLVHRLVVAEREKKKRIIMTYD